MSTKNWCRPQSSKYSPPLGLFIICDRTIVMLPSFSWTKIPIWKLLKSKNRYHFDFFFSGQKNDTKTPAHMFKTLYIAWNNSPECPNEVLGQKKISCFFQKSYDFRHFFSHPKNRDFSDPKKQKWFIMEIILSFQNILAATYTVLWRFYDVITWKKPKKHLYFFIYDFFMIFSTHQSCPNFFMIWENCDFSIFSQRYI